MRFLVDECTGPAVAHWLEQHGHDVFSVYAQPSGMEDARILEIAANEKIFRERRPHSGVVFLRLADERALNKIRVLDQLLEHHGNELADHFVVVTENRVRFAKA